ncbi:helix-turn-helix domain-containing protein [Aquimarina rhabdastrellae]
MLAQVTGAFIFSSLVLLTFIFIANPLKVNSKANLWFGMYLFLWGSFWFEEAAFLLGFLDFKISSNAFLALLQFLTPITFYISIAYFTNPNFAFDSSSLKLLPLPILYLILSILTIYTNHDLKLMLLILMILHSILFSIISILKIRKHQRKIQLFASNTSEIDLKWLEYLSIISLVNLALAVYFNIIYYNTPLNSYMNFAVLVLIYLTAYYGLKQKEVFPVDRQERNETLALEIDQPSLTEKRQLLSNERIIELKSELTKLMEKEAPFLQDEINLSSLANALNITAHQLSYLLNNGFNQNFFQFINTYRVERAKQLLLNNQENKLSILGIAFESGFKSKTSFNTTFKKITGLTPSQFKKSSNL